MKCVKEEFDGFDRADSKLRVMGAAGALALGRVDLKIVEALNEAVEPYELTADGDAVASALSMGLRLQQCCELVARARAHAKNAKKSTTPR
mmetsp:Transcript_139499/g.313569  ORF Transcript_139499/g.313569 Transcript_139499/m.313569 type:complete len:91 (-) Transcript_139499:50-322(-)